MAGSLWLVTVLSVFSVMRSSLCHAERILIVPTIDLVRLRHCASRRAWQPFLRGHIECQFCACTYSVPHEESRKLIFEVFVNLVCHGTC